jgi:hypothetical protein
MSHGDDDDSGDDDAQLRSLRAVWLAMPDEDPPERGLDQLLAAARTKAGEMASSTEVPAAGSNKMPATEATPSWWERFVAGFRRPPMLALATVLVLAAGVAVIGNRQMSSAPSGTAPTQSVPPSQEEVSTQRREQESLKQEAPPPPADEHNAVVAPRVPGPENAQRGSASGFAEGTKDSANVQQQDAITATGAAGEGKVVAIDAGTDRTSDATKQKLLDAAKTAAARGDCGSARSVARQLEKEDASYYRLRVVPDPGIADCLQDRKTGAASIERATTTAEPAN